LAKLPNYDIVTETHGRVEVTIMLTTQGFDLWADGYDKSVEEADESNAYPFAGYRKLMNAVYNAVMVRRPCHYRRR
jgi:hypothetical protein